MNFTQCSASQVLQGYEFQIKYNWFNWTRITEKQWNIATYQTAIFGIVML